MLLSIIEYCLLFAAKFSLPFAAIKKYSDFFCFFFVSSTSLAAAPGAWDGEGGEGVGTRALRGGHFSGVSMIFERCAFVSIHDVSVFCFNFCFVFGLV